MRTSAAALPIDISAFGLATDWFPPVLMPRPHRHNEVELNFVEQGSMTYLFGGVRSAVRAGQMALFWATIPHQVIITGEQTILHWITIPFVTFLQWQLPDVLTHQIVRGLFIQTHEEVTDTQRLMDQALFRQWYNDLQQNADVHRKIVMLEVEARLHRLALAMTIPAVSTSAEGQAETGAILANSKPNKVERIACFIAEHYTEPLSIERIAQTVHLHPNYAISLFRKTFGMSLVDYITQYRVAHAQRLLATTDASVSSIALEAGFGSVSRFYTAFNRACGQSPATYRAALHDVPAPRQ
jgi:AraC-like DNA-binding protein